MFRGADGISKKGLRVEPSAVHPARRPRISPFSVYISLRVLPCVYLRFSRHAVYCRDVASEHKDRARSRGGQAPDGGAAARHTYSTPTGRPRGGGREHCALLYCIILLSHKHPIGPPMIAESVR